MAQTIRRPVTDPGSGVRGGSASGEGDASFDRRGVVLAAPPRTPRTLADEDREIVRRIVGRVKAEALEAFRASDPRRSPLPWPFEPRFYFCCSYCGADSLYGVCRAHRDLPYLERERLAA